MVDAAQAYLQSLDAARRDAASLPVDADEWRTWCNVHIYMWRHGLLLEDLDAAQRSAALGLLRASLSARGFDDVRDVMRFNEVLRRDHRQPGRVRRVGLLPEHLRHARRPTSRGAGSSTATT